MKELTIKSGQGTYQAKIFKGFDSLEELLRQFKDHEDCVFLCDQNVANLYKEQLQSMWNDSQVYCASATEEEKTLSGVGRFTSWLQGHRCTRQTVVVAIGGGIMQDIASFSTHVYYRGIPWIFVPTTLLSMGTKIHVE